MILLKVVKVGLIIAEMYAESERSLRKPQTLTVTRGFLAPLACLALRTPSALETGPCAQSLAPKTARPLFRHSRDWNVKNGGRRRRKGYVGRNTECFS